MKTSPNDPGHEPCDISSVAYQLWQEAGRPPGRYMDFWMKATRLVMDAQKAADNPASKPAQAPAARTNL